MNCDLPLQQKPSNLLHTLGDCRTVYFCGLSKNAGKTVALLQAMDEARIARKSIAVTSIGRDGEEFDAIYREFAKPKINFDAGDLVVTSERFLPSTCTVLHRFRIRSALGPIVAARLSAQCEVEVAGPTTISGLRMVQKWVLQSGVDLFLVDGALDRKAASLPDVSDGIVVSSGASVSDHMDDVLLETCSAIDMLRIPSTVAEEDSFSKVTFSPVFDSEKDLRAAFDEHKNRKLTIFVKGAVTERLVDFLMHEGLLGRCHIVADCFAKVFINRRRWHDYRKLGLKVSYLRSIRILSLTVNPISPNGTVFDADHFLDSMRGAVSEIPVFDVRSPRYGVN